jgi:hypothetical protein
MTLQEEVMSYLQNNPKYRERKYRGHLLCNLALRACNLGNKWSKKEQLSVQELCDFAVKFDSYRHAWGDVTRTCPELRGSDYDEGERLAQEKMMELGYEPGFNSNVRLIKNITE